VREPRQMTGYQRQSGISAVELLLGFAVVAVIAALAVPAISRVSRRSRLETLTEGAESFYRAVRRFEADHGRPPRPGAAQLAGLNLRTLDPLADTGYLADPQQLLAGLDHHRLTAYDTPGEGAHPGFWAILTAEEQPGLQVIAASTDDFPLAPGQWIEGVYLLRGEQLELLREGGPLPPAAGGAKDE